MPDTEILIPHDISIIINERVAEWKELEIAQNRLAEIDSLYPEVAEFHSVDSSSELSGEEIPPIEINSALEKLKSGLKDISRIQEQILLFDSEIKRLIKRRVITILVAIGIILIVIAIAINR